MNLFSNFCRLCLQKCIGPFKILNEDPKEISMVKHILPGMNVDLVATSKICTECLKHVKFAYTMRETIIKNEQKINSNMASIHTIEENTCRLCLNTQVSQAKVFLYENASATISFLEARSIIEIAIVDILSVEIFKKPVVCNICWQIIRLIYHFKKRCFVIEKILKFYSTKNGLTFLTNKDVASISTCYNSNLQKISKDVNTNLVLQENIDDTEQAILTTLHNIIKPVDIYLNNFTHEIEDDIFQEEKDDIFFDSSKIVKNEHVELLLDDVKVDIEEHNLIFDDRFENTDKISKATKEVKLEEERLNIRKTLDSGIEIKNNSRMSKEGKGVPIEAKKIVDICSLENTNYESTLKEVDGNKSETPLAQDKNVQNKLKNNFNVSRKQKVTRKHTAKRCRKQLVKETTTLKNIFEGNHKKIVTPVVKNHRSKSEKLDNVTKSINVNNNGFKEYEKKEETVKKNSRTEEKLQEKWKEIQGLTNSKNISEDNPKIPLEPFESIHVQTLKQVVKNQSKEVEENIERKHGTFSKSICKKKRNYKNNDLEWACTLCEYKTKYKNHLTRHRLIHMNTELFTCPKCVYLTYIKRNLDRHNMVKHSSETVQIQEKNGFRLDLRKVHHERSFEFRCHECPFMTNKEVQIISHIRTHKSNEKIFKCAECHYITTRTHSFKNHMELHDALLFKNKKIKCKLCSFEGKRYTHFLSHMLTHQTDTRFSCDQCSYKAKRKSHLVVHMLRHRSEDKKIMFQCPYCKYKSMRKEHLTLHRRNQHYDKELGCNEAKVTVDDGENGSIKANRIVKCPYCSYRNVTFTVDNHIFKTHFPSHSETMLCYDCSYKSDKRKLFVSHQRDIHGRDRK